jgi:non-specific serine/threonine protein kinase/serine/threonine-protein kinase
MGVVFLAERDDFHQQVALKLVRNGPNAEKLFQRFMKEREILATLEHPNIARLIDGGITDDAMPYLVMEYVQGITVDKYCRQKNLSIEARLDIFRKICSSVAYAHRNLVVHRDLKPSNILINSEGEPKLLDFGIAKLFSPASTKEETITHFQALTPEYASPEQLSGEKLNVSTDVYSLGVILYELLTERRPFETEGKNLAEVLKLVRETEPLRPSSMLLNPSNSKKETDSIAAENIKTWTKYLRGDLDSIILKALRKEPERRYLSVEQFSDDIQRYLEGLPITAHIDSFSYRAKKFAQRNRVTVLAAIMVLLVLVGGISATLWQARKAKREQELAVRRFENLRKISNSFVSEIHTAIVNLPGSQPAREILLKSAVEQLEILSEEDPDNAPLQDELATAYYNFSLSPSDNLNDKVRLIEKSISIYQRLLDKDPANNNYRVKLAANLIKLGDLTKVGGNVAKAFAYNQNGVSILESLVKENSNSNTFREALSKAYYNAAILLNLMGNANSSLVLTQKTINLVEENKVLNISESDSQMKIVSKLLLGANLTYLGLYDQAIKEINLALVDCELEHAKNPNDTRFNRNLWTINRRLAIVLNEKNEKEKALKHLYIALKYIEGLSNLSPKDTGNRRSTAITHLLLGQMLVSRDKLNESLTHFRRALELQENNLLIDPELTETKIDLAVTKSNLGNTLILTGEYEKGLSNLQKSLELFEELATKDSQNAQLLRDFAMASGWYGSALAKYKNQIDDARKWLQKSFNLWSEMRNKNILSYADLKHPEKITQEVNKLAR